MKKILTLIVVVTTALILVACSNKPRLTVYLPNDYVDKDVIKKFEKENNVRVRLLNFDSNEVALAQIKSNKYDVVIPSDYAIEELASAGLLEEITLNDYLGEGFENAPGIDAFLTQLKAEGFDFTKYAVPYFWGNVGILYNNNIPGLAERVKTEGFGVIADQNLKTIIYDSSRDAYMAALNVQGVLLKDATQADITNATEWLKNAKGDNTSTLSDQILTDMVDGNKYAASIVYSGDAAYIMDKNPNYSFYAPANTNVWADGFVIPKNANNKELAKEFIKYMTSYEAAFDNSSYVGYSSPRNDVFQEMIAAGGEYANERLKVAYEASVTPFQFFRFNNELKKMIDNGWEEFLAYKK